MIASKLEFCTSPKGTPYIDLGEGQLVFSKITADPQRGYRYMAYNHRYMDTITIKKKKTVNGKSVAVRDSFEAEVHDSHTFNMWFYMDRAKKKGIPRDSIISVRLGEWLRKTFSRLITIDGILPYSKIPELEQIINEADLETILATKLKRKIKRKPKKRKKKNAK